LISSYGLDLEKEYYPLGIFDNETKAMVIKTQYRLKMIVDFELPGSKNNDSATYEVVLTQSKGIYWFGLIQPHARGIIRVQAIVEDHKHVEPLVAAIRVTGGPEPVAEVIAQVTETADDHPIEVHVASTAAPASTAKPKNTSKPKAESQVDDNAVSTSSKAKDKKSSSARLSMESATEVAADENLGKDSKKRKRSSSIAPVVDAQAVERSKSPESKKPSAKNSRTSAATDLAVDDIGDDIGEADVPVKQARQSKKRRIANPLVDEKYRTLPFPPLNFLPACARIQRPITDLITVQGPQLMVTFPPAVSLAFKDDRLRVRILQMQYPEVMQASSDHPTTTQLQYVTNNEAFPTVNELLYRLENKVSHIADASSIIQSMRNAFEYYFTNNLLYHFEYLVMEDKILDLESRKVKYGDSFGAPFLLRLIVLMIVGVDTLDVLPTSSSSSSSSSPRGSSSSSQRRSAVLEKQNKAMHARLQEILDTLVADLEDNAHLLFY
jgi:hypothetical protein